MSNSTVTPAAFQPVVDEIADGIYRISTWIPEISDTGFTFNQFLLTGDEPLLYHTGMRGLFPLVSEAVSSVIPVESLRWISFGHVEADESGAVNMWLNAAPHAEVVFGSLGCDVSLNDLCDRPPRPLADGEVFDIGGHRMRHLATPHVPHGWEAQALFDETTGTLLCGDVLTQVGHGPALTSSDVLAPALDAEGLFGASSMAPQTGAVLRRLGDLEPMTLAIMHGSSFAGDGRQALYDMAGAYDALVARR